MLLNLKIHAGPVTDLVERWLSSGVDIEDADCERFYSVRCFRHS